MALDSDTCHLPNTAPLTLEGDIASHLVAGADAFLTHKLAESIEQRAEYWARDFSSAESYAASVEPNRQRLGHILGLRDARVRYDAPELLSTTAQSAQAGQGDGYEILAIRWPAFGDVHGEGLLLTPADRDPVADVVALPDADVTPEQLVGLSEGVVSESQYARHLARRGCRVVVPALVDRAPGVNQIPNREYLYRSAFELGRHLIGYEVQKVLALVDWFEREGSGRNVGVMGWGEGGMLALCASALDRRIDAACVSGYFASRQDIWREPIERNVFGLLEQFGDAELASLVAPRALIVETARGPEKVVPEGTGGAAPSRLATPAADDVRAEVERARTLTQGLEPKPRLELVISGDGEGSCGSEAALCSLLDALAPGTNLAWLGSGRTPHALCHVGEAEGRLARQMHEIDRHNQWLLRESPKAREEYFSALDADSPEGFERTVEAYRERFYEDVIGHFTETRLPFNARSRLAYDEPGWSGYEVVLDVFPDVIAYGIVLLPRDLRDGEKRPVVVCQHGLEGRPQDVVQGDAEAYHDFAARLCERGYITFAPQNLYIFTDRFRALQRQANPLGKTLFSIIVPQHQQIVDWLKTLPWVDGERIAFYGLSYGGKTAMRVPPLVPDYCLSICSADYNEWVWKNAATDSPYSYVNGGEYEIFEFDLGSTFNYAEMSWLISPRPFMVERGHHDGVAPDEWVAHEYARTRRHYDLLGWGDRTEMEVFTGPHTINGKGTFAFLDRHLEWTSPDTP